MDKESGELSFIPTASFDLQQTDVVVSVLDTVIDANSGRMPLKLQDIAITYAQNTAVKVTNARGFVLDSVNISGAFGSCLSLEGTPK